MTIGTDFATGFGSAADIRVYKVKVQADGPEAPTSTSQLVCVAQPTLAMLNQQGQVLTVYPNNAAEYDVRLTRGSSDLSSVTVAASSRDSTKPATWGDKESITLNLAGGAGTPNYRAENYDVNGGANLPALGNQILESSPNGYITLTWVHPRDAREFASFTVPGQRIPSNPGFVDVVRVTDVPNGTTLTRAPADLIVLRGGVTVTQTGTTGVMTTRGFLQPTQLTETMLNPNNTPTFVFTTASPFKYQVSIFDHMGQFLNSQEGAVDSLRWEQMRNNEDSMAVAMSILPFAKDGQQFGTGVYILKAMVTTMESTRSDAGSPLHVAPVSRAIVNRFGYKR
jgi:hypothetical protein